MKMFINSGVFCSYHLTRFSYHVDEMGGDGDDTVQSSVTYSLASATFVHGDFENLVLTGSANINATGDEIGNALTGNAGNNVLDGGPGNDTLAGGSGNDTYVVDSASDAITEADGGGTDLVQVKGAGLRDALAG